MAFGVVHEFSGGTREQYEASVAKVHPADGSLPEGQTHHFAGPTEGGWIICAIFESRESWERFRDEVLMVRLADGEGLPPAGARERTFEVLEEERV